MLYCLIVTAGSSAQECNPQQLATLYDPEAVSYDNYGTSVSISGDRAVIGIPGNDELGADCGAANVIEFVSGLWTPVATLWPSDGAADDRFGCSVAVDGNIAVIGAYLDDDRGDNSGSAYVFERIGSEWVEVAKLAAEDGSAGDLFGFSVSVSGSTVIVGAIYDDDAGTNAGAVYLFDRVGGTWIQTLKFTASDRMDGAWFGAAVTIADDVIVVGATNGTGKVIASGSAYVFERIGYAWNEVSTLSAADGASLDCFGCSVASDGASIILVGAGGNDERGYDAGAVYVFEVVEGQWQQTTKLTASDGADLDGFGTSCTVEGGVAIVGAWQADAPATDSGAAYVFELVDGAWAQSAVVTAADGAADDRFGCAVALSGRVAVIGALGDDVNEITNAGSATMFDIPCSQALRLELFGSCPGTIKCVVTNATAGGRIGYVYAEDRGAVTIPQGNPCAGIALALNRTSVLAGVERADGTGSAILRVRVPGKACGSSYMQVIDVSTCETSNVILVE